MLRPARPPTPCSASTATSGGRPPLPRGPQTVAAPGVPGARAADAAHARATERHPLAPSASVLLFDLEVRLGWGLGWAGGGRRCMASLKTLPARHLPPPPSGRARPHNAPHTGDGRNGLCPDGHPGHRRAGFARVGAWRAPSTADAAARPPNPLLFQEDHAASAPPTPLDPSTASTVARLQSLAAPADSYEADVAADAADALCARGTPATPAALAAALAARGHAAAVRTVAGGGRGAACFDRLAHSFVVVAPRRATARALLGGGADASSSIIVDAGFRDALTVAFPPAALAAVLGAVPAVWVGRGERLTAAVSAVAAATRAALAAERRPVPPWRSATALASKWAADGARSVDVAPTADAVAAAAAAGDDGACLAGCCRPDGCESPTGVLPDDFVARAWARVDAGWRAAESAKAPPPALPPPVSQLSAALAGVGGRVRAGLAVRTPTWAAAA